MGLICIDLELWKKIEAERRYDLRPLTMVSKLISKNILTNCR